jgi:hypothetical protein
MENQPEKTDEHFDANKHRDVIFMKRLNLFILSILILTIVTLIPQFFIDHPDDLFRRSLFNVLAYSCLFIANWWQLKKVKQRVIDTHLEMEAVSEFERARMIEKKALTPEIEWDENKWKIVNLWKFFRMKFLQNTAFNVVAAVITIPFLSSYFSQSSLEDGIATGICATIVFVGFVWALFERELKKIRKQRESEIKGQLIKAGKVVYADQTSTKIPDDLAETQKEKVEIEDKKDSV